MMKMGSFGVLWDIPRMIGVHLFLGYPKITSLNVLFGISQKRGTFCKDGISQNNHSLGYPKNILWNGFWGGFGSGKKEGERF